MNKLTYMGKFNGDFDSVPGHPVEEGEVQFKEFEDQKKFVIEVNIAASVVALISFGICYLVYPGFLNLDNFLEFYIGVIVALLLSIPHEIVHGLFFKGEVFLYNYLKKGMFFVISKDEVSKGRFIILCLMPSILFGFIPYILFFFFPSRVILAGIGMVGITSGIGDYINAFNCITQVPKGCVVYNRGFHTYWLNKRKAD